VKYHDFVISFGPREESGFQVTVIASPAGEGRGWFDPPTLAGSGPGHNGEDGREIERRSPVAHFSPQKTGGALFQSLFTGKIEQLYFSSRGQLAADPESGLRIKLRFDLAAGDAVQLHSLPWELLYQPDIREFLAPGRQTPIIRYLEVSRPMTRCTMPDRLRVLAVAASPQDQSPLKLADECDRIRQACSSNAAIALSTLKSPTLTALRTELRRAEQSGAPYHVLHYMGHGELSSDTGDGLLYLETEQGDSDPVSGMVLAAVLRDFPKLRMVFLNACESGATSSQAGPFGGVATALVMGGVPAVVAMRLRISDPQAIAFSATVYQQLAAGDPVDIAVGEGRLAIVHKAPATSDWSIPILFMRTPDGKLFDSETELDRYLTGLGRRYREIFATELMRPDRIYVPQLGYRRSEPQSAINLLDEMRRFWTGSQPRIACLGNYGMGKTYLVWRSVLEQVDRLRESEDVRVPVIFPLREYDHGRAVGLEQLDLVEQIRRYIIALGYPEVDRRKLERQIEDGKLGIILDGLDELSIPRSESWLSVLKPLLDIEGLQVVVSSRTAYIDNVEKDLEGFQVFDVAEWGDKEWHQYLEHTGDSLAGVGGKEEFLTLIRQRPQLAQLTTRPLWCFMIVEVADEIPGIEDLALAGLYQSFLDKALRRKVLAGIVLSLPWRYCAMERFAEVCLRDGRSSLSEKLLSKMLSELFETIGDRELNEYMTKEARTYAFLNCGEARYYSFGHTSVADYFTATGVVRWWVAEVLDHHSGPVEHTLRAPLISEQRLSEEQVGFVAGVLKEEWITSALEIVPPGTGHSGLWTALLQHLDQRLTGQEAAAMERANLFRIYLQLLRLQPKRPFLHGLVLQGVDLVGLDLSECDLKGIDFSDANLTDARLVDSSLAGCSFSGAWIDGCDLTGADLEGAELSSVELPQTPPIITKLKNVDKARMGNREKQIFCGSRPG
jgi:hypothetical protein